MSFAQLIDLAKFIFPSVIAGIALYMAIVRRLDRVEDKIDVAMCKLGELEHDMYRGNGQPAIKPEVRELRRDVDKIASSGCALITAHAGT